LASACRRHVHAAETAIGLTNGLEKAEFLADRTLVDASIKNLSVLGEAATHIPDEIIRQWPDVPWRMMRDMRNLIIHEYFGVNQDIVWGTINDDLPVVLAELHQLVEREGFEQD